MHPKRQSQQLDPNQTKRSRDVHVRPRPLRVFTRSRMGSIKIPRSLRTVILDFTMAFLMESPKDVLKFGYDYFKAIRQRKKMLKKNGRIFEDDNSDVSADSGAIKKKIYCQKCGMEVFKCARCKNIHKVCSGCTKKHKMTPMCAMAQAPIRKSTTDEGDAPMTPHRQTRRYCVYSEGLNEKEAKEWRPPVYEKSEEQTRKLLSLITDKTLFKQLEPDEMETIVNAMFLRDVVANEVVMKQGRGGDFFFVVDSGDYRAYIKTEEGDVKILTNYEGHGSFGELALMYNVPRYCSVKALTDGKLWTLDRDTFRKTVIQGAMRKREYHMNLLKSVPMLRALNEFEMMNVADSLDVHHYTTGDKIIEQGDDADGMFFIDVGKVVISYMDEYGLDVVLDTLENGAYFGELALIEKQKRAATVTAASDVTVAFLQRDAFERLLGPCKALMSRKVEDYNAKREEMVRKANEERRKTEIEYRGD
uniref:cAMP-dependent protein kinase type II regulatory subunit n=1 Tax=Lygus hesperus TaxID=30085 RepID=A0A0A9X102_LYGHE